MPTFSGSSTVPTPSNVATPRLDDCLNASRILGLDFLRAVSILAVLLFHAGLPIDGGLGVEVFFVISGFLITWLLIQEEKRRGHIALGAFYRRRVARLFPAMAMYVAIGALYLGLKHRDVPWVAVAATLTYTLNYVAALTGAPSHYLSHCWSLAVEEQFYLIWPVLLILLKRRRVPLEHALGLSLIGFWTLKAVMVLTWGVPDAYLYRALETRADQLAAGCLLAALACQPAWQRRLETLARWPVLILLLGLGLWWSSQTLRGGEVAKYVVGYSLDPLLILLLIPLVLIEARRQTLTARLINAPVFTLLGQTSYGIYLYHGLLMYPVHKAVTQATGEDALGLLASIGVVVGVAWLSYTRFEQPMRARLLRQS